MSAPVYEITTIPRGQDLTAEDLELIVRDFYVVRNWAALKAKMGPEGVKAECLKALELRLGRRKQTQPIERDRRPWNCRERLREEGRVYPRSSCSACRKTITSGLSEGCEGIAR